MDYFLSGHCQEKFPLGLQLNSMPIRRISSISADDNFSLLSKLSHAASHAAHHAPLSVSARTLLQLVQQTVYVVSEDSKFFNIKLKLRFTGLLRRNTNRVP